VARRRPAFVGLGVFLACLASASCATKKTALVVGVQSEPMGGALSLLHIVIKVGGVVARDETIRRPERSPLGFPHPWEARLAAGTDEGAPIEVEVDAFDAVPSETPLLRRLATTHFVRGRETLLRIRLETRCIAYPSAPRPPGSPPGPLTGPTCKAPETCLRGSCQSDVVPSGKLEPYASNWATHTPDVCKLGDSGPASVQIGTGQIAYSLLAQGQVLQAEAGPQGGHHLWIAARSRNLSQQGSTTTVSAVQPGTGTKILPSTFAFPFDAAEGESCELYGLRYQLDNGGIDYTQFLGKPLDVTVTVNDASGATATSSARIQVAPTTR
jgi:hypothetical protein